MIKLQDTGDYLGLLAIAAVAGAVGGLAAYYLPARKGAATSGPDPLSRWASALIGAISAVAILYFFPPELTITTKDLAGKTTSDTHYDLIKTVALSLIVGSGGRAFLTAMQSRTMAILNQQQATTVKNASGQAVQQAAQAVTKDVPQQLQAAIDRHLPDLQAAADAPADQQAAQIEGVLENIKQQASRSVADNLDDHIAAAQQILQAATPETGTTH